MEKINRLPIADYLSLIILADNWQTWGQEYKEHLDSNKVKGVGFFWRQNIYSELRHQLFLLTQGHCSFCDGYPIGENSKETIEHFYPKNDFPLQAYDWKNLFYCCDKCQSEANKILFLLTLKPDDTNYKFDDYFYFDLATGKLNVLENLENDNNSLFVNANNFLQRYGINNPIRNQSRKNLFYDVKNHLQNAQNEEDKRTRDDFKYRYVYDLASLLYQNT
jgi:uncharacterized protein (TIGR02646 family)